MPHPLNWIEPGEKAIFGLDIVVEVKETVHRLRKLKSHKVAPRELCKQEAPTFTV
jgi:hypothetical protein